VVDNHKGVRDSVSSVLLSRHYAVQSFASGEAFFDVVGVNNPGVAILDYDMDPGMSGLEMFERLRQETSPIHVIFYSAKGTVPVVKSALEGGAISWVIKSESTDELLSKLDIAVEKTLQVAAKQKERSGARENWRSLAPREKRVAPLYAKGKTAQEIADELTRQGPKLVGRRVVEGYIQNIRQKLGFGTANELLIWMIRNHLPPEAPFDESLL
jgi:FixJ family two-component response regulator